MIMSLRDEVLSSKQSPDKWGIASSQRAFLAMTFEGNYDSP
jgi:hypothetical protein